MSFHKELPPRNRDRSKRMIEIRESARVIDSSTTCRIESELADGITRKKRALKMIPRKTRSRNIPFMVIAISGSI